MTKQKHILQLTIESLAGVEYFTKKIHLANCFVKCMRNWSRCNRGIKIVDYYVKYTYNKD